MSFLTKSFKPKTHTDLDLEKSNQVLKRRLRWLKRHLKLTKRTNPQLLTAARLTKQLEINQQKKIVAYFKEQLRLEKNNYQQLKINELKKARAERDANKIITCANYLTKLKKKIRQNRRILFKLYRNQKRCCDDWREIIEINQIKAEIKKNRWLMKDNHAGIISFKSDFDLNNHCFEIRDLNFRYSKKHEKILQDINIDIKEKKVTALIGPSGCGKSTFLKCLNRMHEFTSGVGVTGNIWFKGKNIFSRLLTPLELRSQVGMVFQRPTTFPTSIFENVAYSLKCHGIHDKPTINHLVKEALIDVALWDEVKDKLSFPAATLSGGQQQRLCIARAVVIKPSVLLMDEPTSALDPIAVARIEQLINKLKKNYTIIIVTHSMVQAQRISDETVFFYNGKIIEYGATREFFINPKKQQTKDYIIGKIG